MRGWITRAAAQEMDALANCATSKACGARCEPKFLDTITHVVSADPNSNSVRKALASQSMRAVSPRWLDESSMRSRL